MKNQDKKPNRIAVTWHPRLPDAHEEALKIVQEINQGKDSHASAQGWSLYDEEFRKVLESEPFDLVITLGGDGTMMRTSKLCAPFEIPVCGINMGSFGFLMEIQRDQWKDSLPDLLNGNWRIEDRMLLKVLLERKDSHTLQWEVLNDAVIGHGSQLRPLHIHVNVSGNYLTDYVADGLIVSTATGSTAYSMAAGGPILKPEMRNMLVIPVAPHLSLDRAIVLEADDVVEIQAESNHETIFSPDGAIGLQISESDRLLITASEYSARHVRLEGEGFFYHNFIQYMQRNPSITRKKSS